MPISKTVPREAVGAMLAIAPRGPYAGHPALEMAPVQLVLHPKFDFTVVDLVKDPAVR